MKLQKRAIKTILVAMGMLIFLVMASPASAVELPVTLGTLDNFAVLAGSTITNTGSTTIGGSIGVSPGTAVTGFPPGILSAGIMHTADATAAQAQLDLVTAYNDAASRTETVNLTGQDLGGMTLVPGVYTFNTSAQLSGNLTLDAQSDASAVFVFKIGSTLTTSSASVVNLINGALPSRVFWQVGSSATLNTNTIFAGNILALESITAQTGTTVQGRLLARNGAVTLDTNVITTLVAAAPTPVPTATPTSTPTVVPTPTPAAVPTTTPTSAPTPIPTPTPTAVPTPTPIAVPTSTPTAVPTPTPTVAPAETTTPEPTAVPTPMPTTTVTPTSSVDNAALPDTGESDNNMIFGIILFALATVAVFYIWRRMNKKQNV